MTDVERREVDGDELRQVLRQARDVELSQHVAHDRTGRLHRRRVFAVDEVQRHLHVDLAVLVDALEIDVQDLVLERMHLDVTQEHLRRLAIEAHGEDRRVERLVAQRMEERVVIELDRLGGVGAAVDDAGRLACAAHAAAGSRLRRRANAVNSDMHGAAPDVCGLRIGIASGGSAGRLRLATSP
jgi:hypothetical protein